MPGLTFPSAIFAHTPARMPPWRQLLLVLLLIAPGGQSLAQAVESSQFATDAVSGSGADAILSGLDITRKVLGGDNSVRGAWPSVVALARPGTSRLKDRFFCGGTIVAERWVMTAAHCLFNAFGRQDTASSVRVIAGIHDLVDDAALDEVIVTNIIVHPDYDNSVESPPNDLALLELATVLDAPVGQLFVGESEDYTGTIGYIVGWGATRFVSETAAEYPTTQQEAPVPLVSLAACNSPISYAGLIAVTQMCAGYAEGQIDTCAGDSGGPLYIVENGQVVQMGITSFGNGCGQENFYGIYTNVSHFIPWLSDYLPVPDQSPDLIASREAAINGGTGDDSAGESGGAMNPIYLLLIMVASLVRRLDHCRTLEGRKLWRSVSLQKNILMISVALLMTACSVTSIGAQGGGTTVTESPVKETDNMSKAHSLMLDGDSLRPGFDGLQLGAAHSDFPSELTNSHWQELECKSGKTALRNTGRLFQIEHCSVKAQGSVLLQGWPVRQLELFLLDQQLVRIDVVLAGTSIGNTDKELSELLDATYHHAGIGRWQHRDDQIRLYPGQSLQFIDGRLESSLPELYDFEPLFEID